MNARIGLIVLMIWGLAAPVRAKLVACVGDSITYGAGISDRVNNSYPAQLQRILRQYDATWEVRNFGVSGATLLQKGDRPYIRESAYADALASNPDIVIIKLGTNDSKPQNWVYEDEFVGDYARMIDAFEGLPSRPKVWICKPVPAFRVNFSIRPEVIRDEILPLIDQISREKDVSVIDLYTALLEAGGLFPDGIHPNAEGAGLMAQTIAPFLLGVRFLPDFNDDGVVDFLDYAHLASLWLAEDLALDVAPPPKGDGIIDWQDLGGLAAYWMTYPGLLAHWTLDETAGEMAADRLGRFEAVLHGAPVWRPADGRMGGAVELDGVDDYLSAGSVVNPAEGAFTVFAWVKGGRAGAAILSQSDDSGAGEVWLGTHAAAGALMTSLTDGSRITVPLVSDTPVTGESWHRVRLVWDGSRRYLYVDGGEVAADKRTLNNLRFSTAGFHIGAGKALESGSFWPGLIDDVRIYNRAVKPR